MHTESEHVDFPVLFEDAWCIVVCKPSGILTQAPPGIDSMEVRAKRYLQTRSDSEQLPYLGVPHRLDRPASGVMIFAKTRNAARKLAEQFQRRTVKKTYWALVAGKTADSGHWVDFMHKVEGEPRAEVVEESHPEAQRAELRYVKRGDCNEVSWIEIELITGRTHQIRLQAGSRGFPILGDVMYGSQQRFGIQHEDTRLNAIALHARCLQLSHPQSRAALTLEAPVPHAWSSIVANENTFSGVAEKVERDDGTHTTKAV